MSVILLVLASAIAPLSQVTVKRQREVELRRALRELRTAIDEYKDASDLGVIGGANLDSENEGYPPNLQTLVEGVEVVNNASGKRVRFLRRIPIDPFTEDADWGLRAYSDRPHAATWGGGNVYDVHSRSQGIALNGTRYREW